MGRAWVFGDDVNTDEIMPGRYNITTDPKELSKHVFCEVQPEFHNEVQKGDIIVAGNNFGCGSSREHAPIAIKATGVLAIVAKSFARIFFRNSINIGLPILECPEISDVKDGDIIEVNLAKGQVILETKIFTTKPPPSFILKIIESNGIVNFVKKHDLNELEE